MKYTLWSFTYRTLVFQHLLKGWLILLWMTKLSVINIDIYILSPTILLNQVHRVWYQNHMNLELSIMSNIHFIHSFQFFLILKLVTQKKTNTINEFGMPLHPMYFIWTERIILFLYNLKPLWAVIKYSTRMYTMWWFVM